MEETRHHDAIDSWPARIPEPPPAAIEARITYGVRRLLVPVRTTAPFACPPVFETEAPVVPYLSIHARLNRAKYSPPARAASYSARIVPSGRTVTSE